MERLAGPLKRLAMESPFRLFVRAVLKGLPVSATTRALWDISDRPAYLVGVHYAARRALREGVSAISVIEFGVAGGDGLLALEREAAAVEAELGVAIRVHGFDNGPTGLPEFIGDYRDHPDKWKPGDFPMDVDRLRSRLGPRTTLVLGDVAETVPGFFDDPRVPPIGFVAFDLDLYSSTAQRCGFSQCPASGRSIMCRCTSTTLSMPSATDSPASCSRSRSSIGTAPTSRSTGGAGWRAIGRSRRPRGSRRCTWRMTCGPSRRGCSIGSRCRAR